MSKKILAAIIVFLLVSISLLVIFFELQSVSLDKVSLTLEDLGVGYEESDKEHITNPYVASSGKLFEGQKILESYKVRFTKINETGIKNDSCFIALEIGKLEDRYKEAISTIKNTTFLGYDFTEVESEKIGKESYIGEDNATIFGVEVTIYFIVFRIGNIIVAMVSSGHTLERSIDYARIMEDNIVKA